MASKRQAPQLGLTPELPQVLSSDFNLFYKPDVAPQDKSVDVLIKSLDNFVRDAGTKGVLVSEGREKKEEEGKAVEMFNNNKLEFDKLVKDGTIPKEANPYFIDKYKELTLNKKADEFKARVYQEYAKKNVLENPDPNAFEKFYKDELKGFITQNGLGMYDAIALEKGFFQKTSVTKNSLFSTHVSSQLSKIGEDYKTNFKEGVQSLFDPTKPIEKIGEDVSKFILDKTSNGLGNPTARKYFLESLKEYAKNTDDLDFASKLLRELPKSVKLGTDSIGNVNALKDDFDAIKKEIDERIYKKEEFEIKKKKLVREGEDVDASFFADKHMFLQDAESDPEFQNFSEYKKKAVRELFYKKELGFSKSINPNVEPAIDNFLKENDYAGALKELNNNINRVTESYYNKKRDEINSFRLHKKDGLLSDDDYELNKKELTDLVDKQAKGKIPTGADTLIGEKFEKRMVGWLANNSLDKFGGDKQKRFEAFEIEHQRLYKVYRDRILQNDITLNNSTTPNTTQPNNKGGATLSNDDVGVIKNGKAVKEKADPSKLKKSTENKQARTGRG